jgi:hypothetical protein
MGCWIFLAALAFWRYLGPNLTGLADVIHAAQSAADARQRRRILEVAHRVVTDDPGGRLARRFQTTRAGRSKEH